MVFQRYHYLILEVNICFNVVIIECFLAAEYRHYQVAFSDTQEKWESCKLHLVLHTEIQNPVIWKRRIWTINLDIFIL